MTPGNRRPQAPSTFGRNAALVAAVLGWLFDGFEIGLFPLVGPRALDDLLAAEMTANPAVKDAWFGSIMAVFLVGAACGGVLFGWLGDKIGRVRAMSASILTYAIFTGVCGFATDAWQIAAARFVASLGMGGEWALGVALVSELWPDASRPLLAGIIGAAANAGMALVAVVSLLLVAIVATARTWLAGLGLDAATVDWLTRGDAWRLLMMAGALPGLLVFFIRMVVPESERWEESKAQGGTSHWATRVGLKRGRSSFRGDAPKWVTRANSALPRSPLRKQRESARHLLAATHLPSLAQRAYKHGNATQNLKATGQHPE